MALPPLNIMERSKSLTMIYIGSSTEPQPLQTTIATGDNADFYGILSLSPQGYWPHLKSPFHPCS